jgi:hypothetical protein
MIAPVVHNLKKPNKNLLNVTPLTGDYRCKMARTGIQSFAKFRAQI